MIDQFSPADSGHAMSADALSKRHPQAGERADTTDPGHTVVDVNTADRYELARLPGIGPTLAERIIAERERNGPFANLLDFQRVRGIGPKKAAMLAGWVHFSPGKFVPPDTADQEP